MKLSELTTADLAQPEQQKLKLSELKDTDLQAEPKDEYEEIYGGDTPGIIGSASRGAIQGLTGGFSDEILAAVRAAARTAVEPSIKGKSGFEHLLDNYKKMALVEEQREKELAEDDIYKIAELGSALMPSSLPAKAFGAAAKFGKLGQIAGGAAIGAATAYGKSSEDAKISDIEKNMESGAMIGGGIPVAFAIASPVLKPAVKWGAEKFIEKAQNSPYVSQLAATMRNASKGQTIFGTKGGLNVASENEAIANKFAEKSLANVEPQVEKMKDAFKQANLQGQTLNIGNAVNQEKWSKAKPILEKIRGYEDFIEAFEAGTLTPEEANIMRAGIKDQIYSLTHKETNAIDKMFSRKLAEKLDSSGIIGLLEDVSKNAGTDIRQLNQNIHQAKSSFEPFIQKAGAVIDDPAFQAKWEAEIDPAKQREMISSLIQRLIKDSGRSVSNADTSRLQLAKLQNILEEFKGKNINLTLDPVKEAKLIQERAYLSAAKESAKGIRENTNPTTNLFETIGTGFKNIPFRGAEAVGKGRAFGFIPLGTKDAASVVTKEIFNKSPAELLEIAQNLKNNPKTAKLGDEFYKALSSKNPQKRTNTIFQIMQTPDAKEMLGTFQENTEDQEM